jgi:soluble lytic murein transglycosylase-like protein
MRGALYLLPIGAACAVVGYVLTRPRVDEAGATIPPLLQMPPLVGAGSVLEAVSVNVRSIVTGKWTPPASAARWLPTIAAAEGQHAIPDQLLARLIYQESRFRADVIDGTIRGGGLKKGDAGWETAARGIAQIVPRWHPDVDPLDPIASIYYAANYLAHLARQFTSWEKALAAYNWGIGNLQTEIAKSGGQWLASPRLPRETRLYVVEITADVPLTVYA